MLKRMRRSADLLMVFFVGHLSMVTGGAVCVVPGMQAMAGTGGPAAHGVMAPMVGMSDGATRATRALSPSAMAANGTSSGQPPCSGPAPGSCLASMPCTTALGADATVSLSVPPVEASAAYTFAVLMPASSGSEPELPPPRA